MIGIYKITNKVNNKVYIGQSINIERRWREHQQYANPNNKLYEGTRYLYKAMAKNGITNFEFSILKECIIEQLDILEIKYIKLYNSTNSAYGYNIQLGGNTGRTSTPQYVIELIKELQNTTETLTELANRLGINRRTVYRINIGES